MSAWKRSAGASRHSSGHTALRTRHVPPAAAAVPLAPAHGSVWPKTSGQIAVKWWSNGGQMAVKEWSKSGKKKVK